VHSWKLLALGKAAAACGCSEVLIWVRAVAEGRWRDRQWSNQLCAAAAGGNQIAILQLLQGDAELYVNIIKLTEAQLVARVRSWQHCSGSTASGHPGPLNS
jgi:hypothetical protein